MKAIPIASAGGPEVLELKGHCDEAGLILSGLSHACYAG